MGQFLVPPRQLQLVHRLSGSQVVLRIFLLCPDIIVSMFGMPLYEILIVDLLKYLSNSVFLKCLSTRAKNFAPIFVLTDWLKGGLNQSIFLDRLLFRLPILSVISGLLYSILSEYPALLEHLGRQELHS